MNEDRWRRVEELYHAARLLTASARAPFLAAATAGDEELRHEVESLLVSGGSSPGILDAPVPASLSGRRIGSFAVHEQIGAGGMGDVYRAHDSSLRRDVAFKVLAADVIEDDDRQRQEYLRRFRHEAHALAALNHPNIAAIYGLTEADGVTALVMELVHGSTLADRIAHGPVPPAEALPIAKQIADALEAAHRQGIIHRDLKPANIKLRPDGTVKVLDFGLAKHVGADRATRSLDPAVTEVGQVLGTPAYMAPEQVQGKESDRRADLFALGLVLYEMVAARLPFPGASLGSMLASGTVAVIDPPCQGRSRITSRLNALILRLLERDPALRPESAAAVRHELLELGHSAPVRTATMVAAAGAGVMVLAAASWWSYSSRAPARRWPQVSGVTMITTYAGNESTPSISPDGTVVAFSWTGEDGKHQGIYVTRSDGQEEPHQLTRVASPDASDVFPAWSPDQTQIAFVRKHGADSGDIIVIPAQGGPERTLREIRFVRFPASSWLAWTPDGAQLAFASQSLESGRSTLTLMRLADGTVRKLTAPPNGVIGDASPAFSPDGRSLAFLRWSSPTTSTLLVQTLNGDMEALGEPAAVRTASAVGSPAWADNKRLLFAERGRILEWEPGTDPEQIYLSSGRLTGLAIAAREAGKNPKVVAAQQSDPGAQIWTLPLRTAGVAGGPPAVLSRFGNNSDNPDYSLDGKHIVFVSRRSGTPEVWMTDGDGANLTQLTRFGVQSLGLPRWSPDNRHVAFFARIESEPQIYVIDATSDQPVPRQATHEVPGCNIPSWSRSGMFLYCSRRIEGEMRLFRVPAEHGQTGESEMERWFEGKSATETSDGRVLYIKNDRPGLFARSLAGDPTANPEERLVEDIRGPIGYFAPVTEGVYYTAQDSFGRYVGLRFFDYARRQTVDVAPQSITGQVNSLIVTPAGTGLVYTQVRRAGIDLTLLQFQ